WTPAAGARGIVSVRPASETLHKRRHRAGYLRTGWRWPGAERRSSVGCLRARWRSIWCHHQFRVVDDIADIFVVADEADPTVLPLQPHEVAGLCRLKTVVDRDSLAALKPGGDKPHRAAARIDAEEHADIGRSGAKRVRRLYQPHVVGQHRAQ